MEILRKQPTRKGTPEMFVGDIWIDAITQAQPPSRIRVNVVRFAPGARSIQARGADVLEMRAGDTVYTPPGEWHWHGAARSLHDPPRNLGSARRGVESEWGEQVSDADYLAELPERPR